MLAIDSPYQVIQVAYDENILLLTQVGWRLIAILPPLPEPPAPPQMDRYSSTQMAVRSVGYRYVLGLDQESILHVKEETIHQLSAQEANAKDGHKKALENEKQALNKLAACEAKLASSEKTVEALLKKAAEEKETLAKVAEEAAKRSTEAPHDGRWVAIGDACGGEQ
jgi:hypothetical protein